jgi:excinuclease ABC subunit A
VVLVDQSILGKTPRSNPAVYIGAFDDIREVFAQSEAARQRGLNASAFSFNSAQGQCQRCRGAGFEKIEMQFLSDVFIRCPDCDGRRYRAHILEIKLGAGREEPTGASETPKPRSPSAGNGPAACREFSIADLLEATVEEAIEFLCAFPDSRPARRASRALRLLAEVGLGYVKLGQPINTLSGGESQRLKLVRHLAEVEDDPGERKTGPGGRREPAGGRGRAEAPPMTAGSRRPQPLLFLFDEPTTGLHFDDVRVLLKVFNRLVEAGHSVVVIEHNLDVIRSADWLIDLGPEAGDGGAPPAPAALPAEH